MARQVKQKNNIIKTVIAFFLLAIVLGVATVLTVIDKRSKTDIEPDADTMIQLYGEIHGQKKFYDVELEAWSRCYKSGMRNLFVELPYYTAEYLNYWMQTGNDEIIDQIFEDIQGTQSGNAYYRAFFLTIKKEYPETVFYGTDVGHQYNATGVRFLEFLSEQGKEGSAEYAMALKNIEQGRIFSEEGTKNGVSSYRENCMVENFIETYDRVGGKIMGIYGSYHTDLYKEELMAGRLHAHYGDIFSSQEIINLLLASKPYQFGFSYVGLAFLIMLFVPNIIWTKHKPEGYEVYAAREKKSFVIIEKIGEVTTTCLCLIFSAFNPCILANQSGVFFDMRIMFLYIAATLMIFYEIFWIRYFCSKKKMSDFYRDFLGFPLAGATLPVLAFLILGIYGQNVALIISSVFLGIGHIGIHAEHAKNVKKEEV